MANAFIGEIRAFGGSTVPNGWAPCNGQLLNVDDCPKLFAVIGNTYGGDGKTEFALPDLTAQAPMGAGSGEGLTPRQAGQAVGEATVALQIAEIPSHGHTAMAVSEIGDWTDPTNGFWAEGAAVGRPPEQPLLYGGVPNVGMSPEAIATAGGNQPHNNMQPYVAMNFMICLEGDVPTPA
ncbi:phage tail protein [Cohnella zeiphila]|uniref:Phage tail protein n=1 Tax=Cohnella zeiphila TaxID=2761120 RepID=A0A7X0SU96_9BACL|nr:tail fiber protein [Cohnella zeiphila]MBB6735254.1 phage tail protein [Cohnella zeiphila]